MFFPFVSTVWIATYVNKFDFSIFGILSDHENCFFVAAFLTLDLFPWHGWILAEILVSIDSLKLMRVEGIDSVFGSSFSIDNRLEIAVLSGTSVSQMSIDDTRMESIVAFLTKLDGIALAQIQAKLTVIFEHY